MGAILVLSILIIMGIGILMVVFIRSGEALARKWPNTGYTRWWRRHIIDKNPWEE